MKRWLFPSLLAFLAACGGGSSTTTSGSSSSSSATTGSGGASTSTGTGGSSTSSAGGGGSGGSTSSTTGTGGGPALDVDAFTGLAASALCAAITRCCDTESQSGFFGALSQNQLLAGFASKIPPQHAFVDQAECEGTVAQMMSLTPFGDWVAQAKAGLVTFDPAAALACQAALDGAACGKEVTAALTDGTCFGFAAPLGGPFQRKSFHRSGKSGDVCVPIRDGVGSGFYGTCDPTGYFCCYADPAKPGTCALPFDGSGAPRKGACKAASKVGEACSIFGGVQVCVTGTSCDSATDHCISEATDPLALGVACVDANFNLLGVCQDSWCDVLGSSKCEPRKADGAACQGGDECQSTACVMAKCGAPTFCVGP